MCEKRKNGAECMRGINENINLNKIQRFNERVSQDKESLERHNDSLQNKKVRKFVALLTGVLGCLDVNRAAKKHAC